MESYKSTAHKVFYADSLSPRDAKVQFGKTEKRITSGQGRAEVEIASSPGSNWAIENFKLGFVTKIRCRGS